MTPKQWPPSETELRAWPDFYTQTTIKLLDAERAKVAGLVALLDAVVGCEFCHDTNGHAFLKVPARSITDLGAQISSALRAAKEGTVG